MTSRRRLALILAFFALTSCQKSAPTGAAALIGTWNWVLQYNNGFYSGSFTGNPTGDTLTPANTGIRETLTFTATGQWRVVRNGVTVNGGNYKIDTIFSPAGPLASLDLIKPGGVDSFVNHTFRQDTLVISNMEIITVGVNRYYVKQ